MTHEYRMNLIDHAIDCYNYAVVDLRHQAKEYRELYDQVIISYAGSDSPPNFEEIKKWADETDERIRSELIVLANQLGSFAKKDLEDYFTTRSAKVKLLPSTIQEVMIKI